MIAPHTSACCRSHLSTVWAAHPWHVHEQLELARAIGWREWADLRARQDDAVCAAWTERLLPWLRSGPEVRRLSGLVRASEGDMGESQERSQERSRRLYAMVGRGVAIVPIVGATSKTGPKHGTSSVRVRHALRMAVRDAAVRSIVLAIDSPGGDVAGTHDLAEDVRAAAAAKRVVAQIEDLSASAAVWAMSGASEIVANHQQADVGAVGTYAVLYDESRAAELEGVKVHVVSTGSLKGAGVPGTPIGEDVIAWVRERVEGANGMFRDALQRHRRLTSEQLETLSSGRTWSAQEAIELGLVDRIRSLDDTVAELSRSAAPPARTAAVRAAIAIEAAAPIPGLERRV